MKQGPRSALVLAGSRSDLVIIACQLLASRGIRAYAAGVPGVRLLGLSRACAGMTPVAESREELEAAGPRVLERAAAAARACGADLIFPADVPGAILAGRLRPHLPQARWFPFPDEKTLRLLDDKWTFDAFLRERGLPAPRTWRLERASDAAGLPLPLMLKAPALAGGRGVHLVKDAAARDALLGGSDPDLTFPMLAQEFIPGEDVGLSFLAHEGRLVSWCVQMNRAGGTDYVVDGKVVELGRRIVEATRYTGLANIDLRYEGTSRSSARILEFNPRLWLSAHRALGLAADFQGRGIALAYGEAPAPFEGEEANSCSTLSLIRRNGASTSCEKAIWAVAKSDPLPFVVRVAQARISGTGGRFYV